MGGQLRDIHGLDAIPWWPLAPGWWLAAAAMLALLLLAWQMWQLIRYPPGSWQREARRALRRLLQQQQQVGVKQTASELSELLRRVEIARFGRQRTASLSGKQWLEWLQQSDRSGFDWSHQGRILLTLPYAPDDQANGDEQVRGLIRAALQLVSSSREDVQRTRRWGRRYV